MTTVLLLLLIGLVQWTSSHPFFSKEPPRITRLPYDDWRPVREAPNFGRHVGHTSRFPVYHKSHNHNVNYMKKVVPQQSVEQSETVEVFSPVPPTILGSFSVFGHATVNAREHASHITKKSPKPQLTADYPQLELPKYNGYQFRQQYLPAYVSYSSHDVTKRPQKYDYTEQNAYYIDSGLRTPNRDVAKNSYQHTQSTSLTPNTFYFDHSQSFQPSGVDNSYHKARKPHNPYQLSTGAPSYSTTSPRDQYRTQTINQFEPSSVSYYNNLGFQNHKPEAQYFNNPFGDIHLSTRRPFPKVKPVVEEKDNSKDIYDQYSHLSRPFQSSQPFGNSQKDVSTFTPYVTTYPNNIKFSDVAHPFQINDEFETKPVPIQSDYFVTQQPQDIYPLSVTTIDIPSEFNKKDRKTKPTSRPRPHGPFPNHKPKVEIGSYQVYSEKNPPFLPTPSTDVLPYLSEPTVEQSTHAPENEQDYNILSTMDNKYHDDETTAYPTTTLGIETTTTPRPTHKPRRRPQRPQSNEKYKNHRENPERNKHRRRKPSNKNRDKPRSTTTTTPEPEIYEVTNHYDFTTINEDLKNFESRPDDDSYETYYNSQHFPENIPKYSSFPTTTTTTTPATVVTTEATTNRSKNKYGSNRPRFSIKDYKERLNRSTTTTAPNVKTETERNKENRYSGRIRNRTESTTEQSEVTTESKYKKYKSRIGPSRYKTSTTAQPEILDTTTTERVNTFKPSTNRYKPGTGKYYSRYRTSTIAPKEIDDSPVTTTARITIRPKGVFSAKRRPFPIKAKGTVKEDSSEESDQFSEFEESLKIDDNEVFPDVLTKKIDDASTTALTSGEDTSLLSLNNTQTATDPTGVEAMRIADLTSSSTNDFQLSSLFKSKNNFVNKRRMPGIALPTEEPILPLEAFFQTQNKDN